MKRLRIDIERIIKELEIAARELVTTRIVGRYKSVFRGKGLEFEDYRAYTPQDDASNIDWKASLRTNRLLIKEFKEERNLNVFFLIDTSQSMLFGSSPKLKSEYAATLAASLAYLIQRANDSFGYALFNDKVVKFRLPARGMNQFRIFLREISDLKNWGNNFRFSEALNYVFNILDERTIVIIISDFIGLEKEKNWKEIIKLFARKFDTIAMMIRDKRDEKLPEENIEITIQDPYSEKILFINSKLIAKKYESYVKRQEEEIRRVFTNYEVDFIKLRTDKPFVPLLIELFKKREQRLRLIS